ncbi:uncharacterized protein KD926_005014 [Aspergillus affinis]|uniref:uncharacterized protein n=1 Tax=Aspergillus affinis TaxID=1070780 RepID=UPI0022FE6BC2|nr:uncharacterized protein KD926_005014 [Aspergillus affinis]KAI9034933.1 hypothetical protein KD926_005014 [Aspergillus affinis]
MKISSTLVLLFTAGICGIDVRESSHPTIPAVDHNEEDQLFLPQDNYDGWVNPEDLSPMPQCIAQQDQSTWLRAMTKCTDKQCTSHFTFICTHHQWLTQLSCLSTEFSPDVIKGYFAYCDRSILARAQLYQWIRTITGRTWLVEVGDSNGLESLSPASLAEGYTVIDVIDKAPKCLTDSMSALSMEPFQHVVASCGFTGSTRDMGNVDRPWEYSEYLRSMIALDFETAGYNLVLHRIYDRLLHQIKDGEYFDKDCFCSTFTMDFKNEPCSESAELDLTKERLWMNVICGSTSLPDNWTHGLKTTQFAYISTDDWKWPKCIADMPKQVIQLLDQCVTDACDLDSSGYCKVRRAVDRACICHNLSYNSCGGSCEVFETRMDYVKWLHGLCGDLQDWHGLPENWHQLAAPTLSDMIPWGWTLKSSLHSEVANKTRVGYVGARETCPWNEWKLGSFALVNIATLLAAFFSQIISNHRISRDSSKPSHPLHWFFKGLLIANLHLLANWFNSMIVQSSPGYEDTPVLQLMLLWCCMPRLAWLTMSLIGLQPIESMKLSAAASLLFAESILQLATSYYMFMTVDYGREHNFYLGGLEGAEKAYQAKVMYAGALMWLILIIMTLIQFMRATQNTPLTSVEGGEYRSYGITYGTFSVKRQHHVVSQTPFQSLYASAAINMFLLCIAQWLFSTGFIGLLADEFCPPKLGVLTAVWMFSALISTVVIFI